MGRLAGMEVPFFTTDVDWLDVSVPSDLIPQQQSSTLTDFPLSFAPPSSQSAAAGFSAFGNPPRYLVWRIHESKRNVVELVEFCADCDLPRIGLRVVFPSDLFESVYVCKEEIGSKNGDCVQLYALTVSGLAYCLLVQSFSTYKSCSIFPRDQILHINLHNYQHHGAITMVAAKTGQFLVGRDDGSVGCFQLQATTGHVHELRDDGGISRLWGLIARNKMVGAIQDIMILEMLGRNLAFVLHMDGTLRVWDLQGYNRVLNYDTGIGMPAGKFLSLAGSTFLRLWVGEPNADASVVPFAILCRSNDEIITELVNVYAFHFSMSDKINFSVDTLISSIPLEEAKLIDVKFVSNTVCILKDDGLLSHNLLSEDAQLEEAQSYSLQESVVADQLFQNAEHASDDLLSICVSVFSAKDQIVQLLSSVFLRRLLQPGVYDNVVMRRTLQDYNRHLNLAEFDSLDCDGVKKEILSLIERESASRSPLSIFYSWKAFCTRYFDHWCKNNVVYGLLAESATGAIGLIRKKSVSLIRDLENVEMLIDGSCDEECMALGVTLSLDKVECEVLFDVLRCVNNISLQLGKAASVVMYEAFLDPLTNGSGDIVTGLLKVLEVGYTSSAAAVHMLELGHNVAWEKQMMDHKSFRKFSIDMLMSLRALCQKATSWSSILNAIESYMKFLVPKKITLNANGEVLSEIETCIAVQATCQIAKVMFECASDVLLFLGYLLKINGQVYMSDKDMSRIQLELLPMVQDIITEWLVIQFIATTPTQGPVVEDFSSQLSSLNIDGKYNHRSWSDKLGKCYFSLAYILLANIQKSSANGNHQLFQHLPDSQCCISFIRNFTGWVVWGIGGEESAAFSRYSIHVAIVLLRQCQYNAVENLLTIVHANLQRERTCESIQDSGGELSVILHLLGCCLLAQACELHGKKKESKVSEAVRCFFRASAGKEAPKALRYLSGETGAQHFSPDGSLSEAAWKLQYYQWAMQIFEQYNINEGATQFARAALEQVDETLDQENVLIENESVNTIKGRLWANIFKFTLDLNQYFDAYCAIITNPDPESKYICLRRFLIVLYERGSLKILCDGQFPFVGLTDKVEQELFWKAERSETSVKFNPYKLLYAFEMHRHNWRKAATYIYKYSNRLKGEMNSRDHQWRSPVLLERLNGLSAAINALHLVDPAYAWVEPLPEQSSSYADHLPSKRSRIHVHMNSETADQIQKFGSITNLEKLEKEYVLTSAEYLLSLSNASWTPSDRDALPSDLVDLLVQTNLYDMAFTVVLKFWRDISLKRELERVFQSLSVKCCPLEVGRSLATDNSRANGHLLTSSDDYTGFDSPDVALAAQKSDVNSQWDVLKTYIENYISYNARLPVVVAQTILQADSQIELPVWLVHMFKVDKKEKKWGMAGQESSPAMLFQIYVDCGRYTEATNLLLEYIESYATIRPNDIVHRKKTSAAWFPYTTVEHLCFQLDQMIKLGRMVDQCNKLKMQIYTTLEKHLKMLKVDSEDALSSSLTQNTSDDVMHS
ncbi:unnamed protein product [Rhodiola kirilowii]